MQIVYRDDLGTIIEDVDEYGVSFVGETVYFNDKSVHVTALVQIVENQD